MSKVPNSIKKEILAMVEEDQKARSNSVINWDEVGEIDKRNTTRMQEIVTKCGWLSIGKVGNQVSHAAWLLVQHSGHNLEFQKQCLGLMVSLPEGEVAKQNIAYLTDRVLRKESGIQRYGTQFINKGAYLVLAPTEDLDNLDKLRAEMDMDPIQEYLQKMGKNAYLSEEEYRTAQASDAKSPAVLKQKDSRHKMKDLR